MKKLIALILVLTMALCLFAGCNGTKDPELSEEPGNSDTSEPAEKKGDFSANVNVNRASDYAANELPLPVTGIGRGISTDVKAKEKYTVVVMTRNSTNPYMIGMWNGGAAAGKDLGIEVITVAPATQDSIEEQVSSAYIRS